MMYDAMKPEIANVMKGLEEGREFAVEHVASHARFHERLLTAMFAKASLEVGQAGHAGQATGQESGQDPDASDLPLNILHLNEVSGLNL